MKHNDADMRPIEAKYNPPEAAPTRMKGKSSPFLWFGLGVVVTMLVAIALYTAAVSLSSRFISEQPPPIISASVDNSQGINWQSPVISRPGPAEITVTGVLRTSGLMPEEKSKLGLQYSSYQVTNLVDSEGPAGYFLESDSSAWQAFEGKCIQVTGNIKSGWEILAQYQSYELNGQYTYARLALVPVQINRIAIETCGPHSEDTVDYSFFPENNRTYTGTLDHATRPAPDIHYDYELQLTVPVDEAYGSTGGPVPQKTRVVTLIPVSNAIWQVMEGKIGELVTVEGYKTWGYAESQYLAVTMAK